MHFSITELLLIAFIVLILFGTKKLRNIGGDLGKAVKGFKDGIKGADDPAAPTQVADKSTIDVDAKEKSKH